MSLPAPPKKQARTGAGNGGAFLKARDIGKVGTKATIVLNGGSRLIDGNYGDQLVLPVTFKGKPYSWGVTTTSVNYRLLFGRFGKNDRKWKGAVKAVIKQGTSSAYIAVVD